MKKFFYILLSLALVLFLAARLYYNLTDDFRLGNITQSMPYESAWEITPPSPAAMAQIEKILDQKFFYLGKGAQSYVFKSADGDYVIKFFKFKHLRPFWLVDLLPPVGFIKTYQEKQAARKERKLFGVFFSYKLGYEVDRDESGLIFVQLNVPAPKPPVSTVTVADKLGITRTIDLATVPFILQKKGETLRTVLVELLDRGDITTAQQRVRQIIDLYLREYKKGIYDHDHGVMQNTGFIQTEAGAVPIHLDVGKLMEEEKMKDPAFAKHDLAIVKEKIDGWIKAHYPQYEGAIRDAMQQAP